MADLRPLHFDGFVLDPADRRLSRDGQPLPIQQKPLELLLALAEAGGRLLDRDQLFAALWPGVFVSDSTLSQAVRKARRVLLDAGGSEEIIHTEAGVGYRMGVPVRRAAAPPLQRISGNLGADLGDLVGRQQEQAALIALLAEDRLVTLTGPGGIGKTTLALAVARALAPGFEGGAWLVELESARDAAAMRRAVAEVLGVSPAPGADPAAALLASLAARGPLLLVLDNLEQLGDQAGPLVLGWLRQAPALRVLATSRARLRLRPERVLELGPLAARDSVALFRRRTGLPDAEEAVRALAEAVEHMPLALELLAAHRALLGIEALKASATRALLHLENPNADAPARQATMRATLDWSWSLLTPATAAALRALAVFAGAFDLGSAAVVVGEDAALHLATLRAASLLALGEDGRLRLSVPVRELARERLVAAGEQAGARDRLLSALAALAEDPLRRPIAELAWARADLWACCAEGGPPERLVAAAELLVMLDGKQAEFEAFEPMMQQLRRLVEQAPPQPACRAATLLARLASHHQRPAEAEAHLQQARALAAQARSPRRDGELALVAAMVAARAGRLEEALAEAVAAEACFQDLEDPLRVALAQASRGTTLIRAGRDADAVAALRSAVRALLDGGAADHALPFALNLVVALGNLGLAAERGALLDELEARSEGEGDRYLQAALGFERGRHVLGEGALERAEALLRAAGRAMRQLGLSDWYCAWALAIALARQGRFAEAERGLDAASRGAEGAGPLARADVLRAGAVVAHLRGDPATCEARALAGAELLAQCGPPAGELLCWAALGALGRGAAGAAADHAARAAALGAPRAGLLRALAAGAPLDLEALRAAGAGAADEDRLLIAGLVRHAAAQEDPAPRSAGDP